MFKQATKDIASELDPYGMLVPVPGANDSFKFELLYLVKKVVSLWPWKPVKYLPTGVKLEQVLVKGDTVDIGEGEFSEPDEEEDDLEECRLLGLHLPLAARFLACGVSGNGNSVDRTAGDERGESCCAGVKDADRSLDQQASLLSSVLLD
ncbi:Non-syndromic hearing impairment protein 5-like [Acipenser ruthenus]|uniref:Non-syndromic hearing impairment protein 5-like n=1 Tax=Acipenser ruthenus TaxID=7906 RepID=A0A444V7L4_ACIRT|nr:Non-syndromic hearing impairment protein 5-like [Acipenser ruthenus]